jgi:hypothetical protein
MIIDTERTFGTYPEKWTHSAIRFVVEKQDDVPRSRPTIKFSTRKSADTESAPVNYTVGFQS